MSNSQSNMSADGLSDDLPIGEAIISTEQQVLLDLRKEIRGLRKKNYSLASAVVDSAETIAELEHHLDGSKATTFSPCQSAINFPKAVFEGTRDALLVFDSQNKIVVANSNACRMFELESMCSQDTLRDHLLQQFRAVDQSDWFSTLVSAESRSEGRIELYRLNQLNSHCDELEIPEQRQWIELSLSKLITESNETEMLITAYDISQRKTIEDRFQHQALHDNVTKLPNRRYFISRVESLIEEAGEDKSFFICFLDLDNFKNVNDTLGHEAGDQLLMQVGKRIRSAIRKDSFLARFGGDEFALLIPNVEKEIVESIACRIVEEIRRPFWIAKNSVFIGASIGMTQFPEDGTDVNSLLLNADVAMYSAKESGRGRFHPFTPKMAADLKERQLLLDDLQTAVENESIELEYQPKWCMKENRIAGCEALLRWQRKGKLVSASHVVDVAECSGLILPLGYLVLKKALGQMAEWRKEWLPNGKVAINVSPHQLVDPNFIARFLEVVEATDIPPNCVELEVTETAMMKNFSVAFERFRDLMQLGVSIAIDDFGTGYSSLSYLKSFPVSTLKIDRSFVRDLPFDKKAVAVARAVLSLGHGLGLNVVAEGVESKSQFDYLGKAGCDQIQGYLLSRSLNPDEFVEFLKRPSETMLSD